VLYWLLALTLLGSKIFFRRNLIERMLEAQFRVPDPIWSRLNLACALFFVFLGLLNLYVAFNFTRDTWVNFKAIGCSVLIFAFALALGFYLSKHLIEDQADG
jgi:intracellular septation protein